MTQNVSQKSSGDKNKEVGGGTWFKVGQLIIAKIIKIVAVRCHILRLKCTKFDFGWGCAPDPTSGAHGTFLDGKNYRWLPNDIFCRKNTKIFVCLYQNCRILHFSSCPVDTALK